MPRRSSVSGESPARLEVRLLGAVEVILDGCRLGAFNGLRLQRFLALITLRRGLGGLRPGAGRLEVAALI